VIGHLAHIEGAVVEDVALVGNGSIVLHRVVVRTLALVGAGAVVPAGTEVPSGAMALGVPARIRPDVVTADQILPMVENYVERARQYRDGLRRID
jgi:carbonic anhydrase/acetyltransferase-like protein (isoleucine patch superfamily)